MNDFPNSPFWDFSLFVYGQAGVAPACLDLQERRGADVNLLLFAGWYGASGRGRLTADNLAALEARVGSWHREVVRPLRALRVALRRGFPPLAEEHVQLFRRRLQELELDAERVEQLTLGARGEEGSTAERAAGTRRADAEANMTAYLETLQPRREAGDAKSLEAVLSGVAAWIRDSGSAS